MNKTRGHGLSTKQIAGCGLGRRARKRVPLAPPVPFFAAQKDEQNDRPPNCTKRPTSRNAPSARPPPDKRPIKDKHYAWSPPCLSPKVHQPKLPRRPSV